MADRCCHKSYCGLADESTAALIVKVQSPYSRAETSGRWIRGPNLVPAPSTPTPFPLFCSGFQKASLKL